MTDAKKIYPLLSSQAKDIKIYITPQTGSTNDDMKKMAGEGEEEISLLIADSQTKGRGRHGKSFFSPKESGIYMSFLIRPDFSLETATLLTSMTAVAVAEAIEEVTKKQTLIKWVNDIFIDNRKVSGILTEASLRKNRSGLEWAVIGIGINLAEPDGGFPDDIKSVAGAIGTTDIKHVLAAEIINRFIKEYRKIEDRGFTEKYRKRQLLTGKEITVIQGEESYNATAKGTDDMCHLIIEPEHGGEITLYGGEVSVRLAAEN